MPYTLYLIPYTSPDTYKMLPDVSQMPPSVSVLLFLWFLQGFFPSRWPHAICRRPPRSGARLRFCGAWWGSRSFRAREMVRRATFDCKTRWFCNLFAPFCIFFAPKTSWSLLGALGPPGCLLHIRGIECMHFYVQHGNPAYRIHAFLCAMLRSGI